MVTAPWSVAVPRRAGNIANSHDGTLRIDLSNVSAKEFNVAFRQPLAQSYDQSNVSLRL